MRRNLEYYKHRNAAAEEVRRAIYRGDLVQLSQVDVLCTNCKQRRAIHYDHRDYDKPLDVQPVCASCNARLGAGKSKHWPQEETQ